MPIDPSLSLNIILVENIGGKIRDLRISNLFKLQGSYKCVKMT